ncbi:brefeldin A-inhibited guanine nucleotide-exchange protein 3-like isoform X2 [Mytilus galloprovincialis]|uniref:brefeldin A-inhibited guanine nucleotide-exchange protein 3-like isoform X2 n=1 Tax=Mytilus galloprovincialis TaxID=29158 RepID=UPI003F7BFB12
MEDILKQLLSDVSSTKHTNIKQACRTALDILSNKNEVSKTPAHILREKCLEPFQLAIESKSKKLGTHSLHGIQKMLEDERFCSSIETESEDYWMPIQVLNAVFCTPTLSEEVQVEVVKVLLNMTFSVSWCMTGGVITRVGQVYIDTFMTSSHSVKGAVVAALTQVLGSYTDKFTPVKGGEEINNVMDDFNSEANTLSEASYKEIVAVLRFFTSKLEQASTTTTQIRNSAPLLLEGIYTILTKIPHDIRCYQPFQEILWKSLCPSLICLLGNPKMEKSAPSPKSTSVEDIGRGSGCSSSAPNLQLSTAKTIYSIALSLVDLMGRTESMRPVLESVFHRMMLYPPPQHRLDALKAVRETLKSPRGIFGLALPTEDVNKKSITKNPFTDVSLIKLIVDSIQESCHCNDTQVCITSVACINDMLGSLEQISRGVGVTDSISQCINQLFVLLESNGTTMHRGSVSEENIESQDMSIAIDPGEDGRNSHSPQRRQTVEQQIILKEEVERRYTKFGNQYEVTERQNAGVYIDALCKLLPELMEMYSEQDVDEALQKFSSKFCSEILKNQTEFDSEIGHMTVLNADSVYVITMTTLLLNMKLSTEGYYDSENKDKISITEKDYLDDIFGCGLMLFVSPAWLSEVYSQTISNDFLKQCGCFSKLESPLLSIIKDIDGLGNHDKGGQLLTKVQKYDMTTEPSSENIKHVEMGRRFCRRILSRCWDSILDVLSVLLNGKNSCGITSSIALMLGTEGAKEESIRAREAICMSLEGLQKAARLCCLLGMPQRCGNVFSHLATTSCVMLHTPKSPILERKLPNKPSVNSKVKPVKLHASHVLSMDVLMTTGLEMGGHSADCWKHLFRCTAFISELEHTYFSQGNNQSNLPKLQQGQPNMDTVNDDDEFYGMPVTAATPVAPRINIPELINQSKIESAWERSLTGGGMLNAVQASQALCGLSQQVDRLFEEAAEKLNMSALLEFLSKLCESSQDQLHQMLMDEEDNEESVEQPQLPQNALHLYRLQEVLMKIVNSNRPLLHQMRVWSVVSGFLVEAAGHRVRNVSKMAVTCVHDFIQAMISNHQELPHFHINEFLCKTFENMLCLELCDGDVQDQVVCSVCELVEACTADLKSGWRPLFGALRAVKIEHSPDEEINEVRQRHVAAVLDVFEVFLNTDNIFVFANATVDCILCLLKYVRGPGDYDNDDSDDDSDSGSDFTMITQGESLCIPALGYLKKCNNILQTMWKMPACPVFNGAHRINSHTSNQFVDPVLPNIDIEDFKRQFSQNSQLTKEDNFCVNNKDLQKLQEDEEKDCTSLDSVDSGITLNIDNQKNESESTIENDASNIVNKQNTLDAVKIDNNQTNSPVNTNPAANQGLTKVLTRQHIEQSPVNVQKSRKDSRNSEIRVGESLESLDNESGILHVWFLMIDGLAGSVACCPKTYQPETLDMLFDLLRSLHDIPGPFFAYYCVNHLLLPMLQTWLRCGVRKAGYWEAGATNFKQSCGLTADLIVDFVMTTKDKDETSVCLRELMLKQLLDILTECVAQPVEIISRLGCSCIRHVFLSAGESFTEEMWQISAIAMENALDVTTYYLQELMFLFNVNSENFYGDLGQVKVAMRKDSTPTECDRLRHLAQQVFLLDTQIKRDADPESESEADKSFVFLLYKPGDENSLNPDDIVTRIPFRNIVIGLLSNQLLLQTVGSILLCAENTSGRKANESNKGLLPSLSIRNIIKFLQCLRQSYKLAAEFDSRPGLKFLIQKVARTEVAVNLYKQAGASMIFYLHTLLQICISIPDLSSNHIKCITGAEQVVKDVNQLESEYLTNQSKMESCPTLFLQLLRSVCDELCHTYVDILSDETSVRVDQMSEQQVFFIIAQPDDFSTNFVKNKKKSRSESETSQDCIVTTKDVTLQEICETADVFSEEMKDDSSDTMSVMSKNPTKSKREMREEHESKVYTLATDTLIKSLMTEYKKRKQHHAMPAFIKISKEKKPKPIIKRTESVDESIAKQRKSSIMKDSEARIQSWTELLCTTLGLFQQQPDGKFRLLQPAIFYCVNQLVCHAEDRRLREALGQWVHRIGVMIDCIT